MVAQTPAAAGLRPRPLLFENTAQIPGAGLLAGLFLFRNAAQTRVSTPHASSSLIFARLQSMIFDNFVLAFRMSGTQAAII